MSPRSLAACLLAVALLAAPSVARSWHDVRMFRPAIETNGHNFYGVKVSEERCVLRVDLHFDAPRDRYDKRTVYRFRAKLTFAEGGSVFTKTFSSAKPGNHVYRYPLNTRRQGCWARNEAHIKSFRVVSCAGARCKLPRLR